MSYAAVVIEKFGGIRPMASKMGLPPSTVQGWGEAGVIPSRRHPDILAKARELNIDLQPSDFFPLDNDKVGKPQRERAAEVHAPSAHRALRSRGLRTLMGGN